VVLNAGSELAIQAFELDRDRRRTSGDRQLGLRHVGLTAKTSDVAVQNVVKAPRRLISSCRAFSVRSACLAASFWSRVATRSISVIR
jgi:hypothetical protein